MYGPGTPCCSSLLRLRLDADSWRLGQTRVCMDYDDQPSGLCVGRNDGAVSQLRVSPGRAHVGGLVKATDTGTCVHTRGRCGVRSRACGGQRGRSWCPGQTPAITAGCVCP
jgi:hypothetical protein